MPSIHLWGKGHLLLERALLAGHGGMFVGFECFLIGLWWFVDTSQVDRKASCAQTVNY
jgi:hypothetical protein